MADISEEYDLIVVGAGISGIAAATAYLDIRPDHQVLIVDRDSVPGGTWNSARLYDTFHAQIGLGMAEFSDMPMPRPPDADIDEHGYMPARYITAYLTEYMEAHVYAGRSLTDRLLLNFSVSKITDTLSTSSSWQIHGVQPNTSPRTLSTRALIIATGPTSTPHMPALPNQSSFTGPILHQKDFGSSTLLSDPNIKNITVMGGAKSAADMVYACAQAGKNVTWVVRTEGGGAASLMPGNGPFGLRNATEFGATRLLGSLSPGPFGATGWWGWFVQKTWLGRVLVRTVFSGATKAARRVFVESWGRVVETGGEGGRIRPGFQGLRPEKDALWTTTFGILPSPSFWPTISRNVTIHRSSINHITPSSLILANGKHIPADALLAGTGWDRTIRVFDPATCAQLGLPAARGAGDPGIEEAWRAREARHAKALLDEFPLLREAPWLSADAKPAPDDDADQTPYRLHNLLIPLSHTPRNVAIIGAIRVPNTFRTAESQALWTAAYLTHSLSTPLPPLEEMRERVARTVAWNALRYGRAGRQGIYFHYEAVEYADSLLRECGLEVGAGGGIADWWMRPAFPGDLRRERVRFVEGRREEGRARMG